MSNFNGESLYQAYKSKPAQEIIDRIGETIQKMRIEDLKRNELAIANILRSVIMRYGGEDRKIEINPSHMRLNDEVFTAQDPETGMITAWLEKK